MRLLRLPVLIFCLSTGLLAQAPVTSPDASALVKDMVRFHVSPSQTVIAYWYPFEMIAAATKLQNPSATDEMMESMAGFMRDYAVFMVQASHKDGEGRETYLSEAEIGAIASVTDNNGHELRRVTDPPPYLATALALSKARFKTQPHSEHLELVVFDNKDAEGAFILHPLRRGGFTLHLRSESGMKAMSLDWETPLPSVAGVVSCARCGAALSPGWNFCPICGLAVPKQPESKDTTPRPAPSAPIRVSGDIVPPTKVKTVNPVYPAGAVSGKVQGQVWIEATIGPDGKVQAAKVLRSIPQLDQAALDAVRQWEFTPTLLNGVAVPVIMTVTVSFSLK